MTWQWPPAGANVPASFWGNAGQTAVGSIGGRLGMAFTSWDGYLRVLDTETYGGGGTCAMVPTYPDGN